MLGETILIDMDLTAMNKGAQYPDEHVIEKMGA